MATSGEIQWPPTGSFPWPPSAEKFRVGNLAPRGAEMTSFRHVQQPSSSAQWPPLLPEREITAQSCSELEGIAGTQDSIDVAISG